VAVAAYPWLLGDPALIREFLYIGILSIVAVGLNFTLGYAGEFALGQAGIFAVGAYTAGMLTARAGWSFWLALPVAVVAAALVGLVVCLPGLRVGGWYFALTSLFVAVVLPDVAKVVPYTGGTQGFGGIPVPSIGGRELTVGDLYLFVAGSLLVFLWLLANVVRSPWGLALASMRASNKAAQASGIAVFRMKLVAYVFAGLLAGYAGAILPHVDGYLAPDAFGMSLSILLVAGVTIGGTGRLIGPVVGIALLEILPHVVSGFDRYSLLIYGSILIIGMLFVRQGILPAASDAWVSLFLRVNRRRRLPEEAVAVDDAAPVTPTPPVSGTLTVSGVDKHFNGVHALRDVFVQAEAGEITAVIGPNGSGKTTLLNVIAGFYRLDAGEISLSGRRLSGRKPFQIARAGLARTFQTPVVLSDHTCRENVMSGAFTTRRASLAEVLLRAPRARGDWHAAARTAEELLRFVGLGGHVQVAAGSLTAGQQRLLDIARALAPGPSVLLLDEPAAGLVGAEVEALAEVLRRLRDAGHAVVLVEHNINLVMAVADRVTVLDRGRVIANADPATVQQDPAVLECYLGGPIHV
jgi:branched-chain amino acid transport system permease protein